MSCATCSSQVIGGRCMTCLETWLSNARADLARERSKNAELEVQCAGLATALEDIRENDRDGDGGRTAAAYMASAALAAFRARRATK